jgi:hypothetical protein
MSDGSKEKCKRLNSLFSEIDAYFTFKHPILNKQFTPFVHSE